MSRIQIINTGVQLEKNDFEALSHSVSAMERTAAVTMAAMNGGSGLFRHAAVKTATTLEEVREFLPSPEEMTPQERAFIQQTLACYLNTMSALAQDAFAQLIQLAVEQSVEANHRTARERLVEWFNS